MDTIKSESYFERSKKLVPGGVHSPVRAFRGVGGTPRFIGSAKGSRLIDVDENEYLDFCQSWGPLIFGHQDEEIKSAIISALNRGWSFGATETLSLELAEEIFSGIPWLQKIRFVNSGTEAVMSAVRLARGFTGRDKILKFEGCYHGHSDSMLVQAGSGLAEMPTPSSAGVPPSIAQDTLVAPLDDEEAIDLLFSKYRNQIAAVIIEPLPANHGLLPQRLEFLKKIRSITTKENALLIFDEVISGFRVAFGGMAERTQVTPDLVTYGKVIGGGFPVGAFAGRKDVMDLIAPIGNVYQAGTLSANPIAMTAGLSTIRKLKKQPPYSDLEEKGEIIDRTFQDLQGISPQRVGSIFWTALGKEEIVRRSGDISESHSPLFRKIFHSLLSKGIYLAPSGFEVGFLSTAHTKDEVRKMAESFRDSLQSELYQ